MTDYVCPYEGITNFALVSKHLRLQSCRWLGWMYETSLLNRIEWVDERSFIAVFCGDDRLLTVHCNGRASPAAEFRRLGV